jgi:hypothetical protein
VGGVIAMLDVHAQRIDHLIGTSRGVNSGGNHQKVLHSHVF